MLQTESTVSQHVLMLKSFGKDKLCRLHALQELEKVAPTCGCAARGLAGAGLQRDEIEDYLAKHGLKEHRLRSPNPLLSSLPSYTAGFLYAVKVKLHCYSLPITNISFNVLAMALFYKAMRHYRLFTTVWQDLELVIAQQSIDRSLVTKTPANANPRALARHYQMALGVPASTFSRNQSLALPKNYISYVMNARVINQTSRFGRACLDRVKGDRIRGIQRENVYEIRPAVDDSI